MPNVDNWSSSTPELFRSSILGVFSWENREIDVGANSKNPCFMWMHNFLFQLCLDGGACYT